MDGSFGQSERRARVAAHRRDAGLRGSGQPGGRDVDGLLEERPVERIRLVEEGQDVERAADQQPFEGDLASGHERLDEQGAPRFVGKRSLDLGQDRRDAPERRDEFPRVVRADHAAARREHARLEDARVLDLLGDGAWIVAQVDEAETRHRNGRVGEASAHRVLVARGGDGGQGIRLEPEPRADGGGHDRGEIVDRDDGVDRPAAREPGDRLRAGGRIVEVERDEVVGRVLLQRARPLRGAHELDAHPGRGGDERLGAIRRGG